MDPLEIQLRRYTRSWPALVGAACTSALLFVAMASSSIVIHPRHRPEEPPLTYAFAPPPRPEVKQKSRPPVASSLKESFKFDPSTAGPPPDIPLEMLTINLNPSVDPGTAIELDMQRTFEVQKPEPSDRLVIFNRDQVDELPVWLFGPQPRTPSRLDRTDWTVLVLYSVSEKGVPDNIYILDATDPALVKPVKEAIADWHFRPARKAGKSVKIWVQQPVKFIPDNKSPFTL